TGNLDPDPSREYALLIQGTVYTYNLENFGGDPLFSSAPVDVIGFSVDHFDLGDIDSDGLDDLVAGFGVVVVWYPNTTDFAISFDSEVIVSSDVIDVQMFAFGDIDGDMDTDIAAIPGNANKVIWFKNGDGLGQVFSSPKNLLQPFENGLQVFLADLDQDGDLDGVGTRQDLGLYWAENSNGSGQFTNPSAIKTLAGDPLNFATVQAIHDLDGDDYPDFLLRYKSADTTAVGWLSNALALGDDFVYQPPVLSNTRFVKSMDAGDYDQDGDMDFVALSGRGGPWNQDKLTLYKTQNNSTIYQIALTSTVPAPNVNGQPDYEPFVRFEDVDQDGDLDILAFMNWKLVLLENLDGQGQYSAAQELYQFPTESGYALAQADLNDDGLLDIVGRTVALLNQPNLTDYSLQSLGFANNIKRAQPIDFDSDGDKDVLLLRSTSTEDLFFLAENLDGQGTSWDLYPMNGFEPELLNWQDFFPMDYDKDGDEDLVYIKHSPLDHLVWQEQVSPGEFSNAVQIITPIPLLTGINTLNYKNFFLVDVNADEWMDFVFSDEITNSIFILFRTPGVNFLTEIVEVAGDLDSDYHLTGFRDVTGNGRPDFLVTADAPKGYVAWIRNFLGSSAADQGKLEVFTYVDNDGNGSYQPTIDAPLPGVKMDIQPNDVTAVSSARGISQVPVGTGTEYTLTLQGDPDWILTSGPASVSFMPDTLYEATLEFGLSPNQPVYSLAQLYDHSPAVCSGEVQQWFTLMNTGNQTCQAWAEISYSPANLLIPFFNSSTQPDSVTASHNYWRFDQITPGEAEKINFICQSAGSQFEGQTVQVHFAVYYYDQNGNFLFLDSQEYDYEFQCTETSNRKTVRPLRIEPEHYFVEEDLFHYRIRYQNPGDDPVLQFQISDALA
ncbi:MAG: VCBS repeat-containing protein, partial [Phaeodactylibacter sp.]|nr:VCBS repeat-containing protein [Phaeodactylibacter sp.]